MFRPNVTAHRRPAEPGTARKAAALALCLALGLGSAALPAHAAAPAGGGGPWWAPLDALWTDLIQRLGHGLLVHGAAEGPDAASTGDCPSCGDAGTDGGPLVDPNGLAAQDCIDCVDPQHAGVADPNGESTEDCVDCVDPQHRGVADPNG